MFQTCAEQFPTLSDFTSERLSNIKSKTKVIITYIVEVGTALLSVIFGLTRVFVIKQMGNRGLGLLQVVNLICSFAVVIVCRGNRDSLSTYAVLFFCFNLASYRSSKYVIFDPAREINYDQLDDENRKKGKALIDSIVVRLGKTGPALLDFMIASRFFPGFVVVQPFLFFSMLISCSIVKFNQAVCSVYANFKKNNKNTNNRHSRLNSGSDQSNLKFKR